jgi:hypothetical protein
MKHRCASVKEKRAVSVPPRCIVQSCLINNLEPIVSTRGLDDLFASSVSNNSASFSISLADSESALESCTLASIADSMVCEPGCRGIHQRCALPTSPSMSIVDLSPFTNVASISSTDSSVGKNFTSAKRRPEPPTSRLAFLFESDDPVQSLTKVVSFTNVVPSPKCKPGTSSTP